MENSRTITQLNQLPTIAEWILAQGRKKICLYGDLGAGKTTLVKTICAQLGAKVTVSSPTFSLVNEYAYTDATGQAALIYHLDLYRLRSLEEALDMGILDYLDSPHYCFIEWAQVIEPLFVSAAHPADGMASDAPMKINISTLGESARKFVILSTEPKPESLKSTF